MTKVPNVLTIAGSDSSGGAGIQADIKTFTALNVYGASVITNITAQNSIGVRSVHPIPAEVVKSQLEAVISDIEFKAIKIGMLYSSEIIKVIAETLRQYGVTNIILDPVMISSSGKPLLEDSAKQDLIEELFPLCTLITPNLPEAADLYKASNETIPEFEDLSASNLTNIYKTNFLVKGGHQNGQILSDTLYADGITTTYKHEKFNTPNTHGTGCTLSSAICAHLALGYDLIKATELAINFTQKCIKGSTLLNVGKSYGPVNQLIYSGS